MLRSFAAFSFVLLTTSMALANPVVTRVTLYYSTDFPNAETPIPSLTDIDGNYVGFTHRLPGTGGALAGDDPSLRLFDSYLELRGQSGGLTPPTGLDGLDMPAVSFINPYSANEATHYAYGGIALSNIWLGEFGKAGVFIGVDAANLFLAGVEAVDAAGNYRLFASRIVNGVETPVVIDDPGQSIYAPGTDVDLMFGRATVLPEDFFWVAASTADSPGSPAPYDASGFVAMPEISSELILNTGIFNFDSPDNVLRVDSFIIASTPEPSTYALGALALLGLLAFRRRR